MQIYPLVVKDHYLDWQSIYHVVYSEELARLINVHARPQPVVASNAGSSWFDRFLPEVLSLDYDGPSVRKLANESAAAKVADFATAVSKNQLSPAALKGTLAQSSKNKIEHKRAFNQRANELTNKTTEKVKESIDNADTLVKAAEYTRNGSVIILGVLTGAAAGQALVAGSIATAAKISLAGNSVKLGMKLAEIEFEKGGISAQKNQGEAMAEILDATWSVGMDCIPVQQAGKVGAFIFTATMDFAKDISVAALKGDDLPEAMQKSAIKSLMAGGAQLPFAERMIKRLSLTELQGRLHVGEIQKAKSLAARNMIRARNANVRRVVKTVQGSIAKGTTDAGVNQIFAKNKAVAKAVAVESGKKKIPDRYSPMLLQDQKMIDKAIVWHPLMEKFVTGSRIA